MNDSCGCCEAPVSPTPELITNRPGLPAIVYRVGSYASFRQAMVEAIAQAKVEVDGQEFRPLQKWTARQSDDYGIALLEMWAYLADILTFYQERIANEAFLRTATLRESVLRLAAMLDYKPSSGVAATTYLAFTLEKGAQVQIPAGLRVQSVPGQDEKAQKFETVQAIKADANFNKLQVFPQPQMHNPLAQNSTGGVLTSVPEGVTAGAKLVVFDATHSEIKGISKLSVQDVQTALSWTPQIQQSGFKTFTTRVVSYNRRFQLFGHNAPKSYMEPKTDKSGNVQWTLKESPKDYSFGLPDPDPSAEKRFVTNTFALDASYGDLKPGARLLFVQGKSSETTPPSFARMAAITNVSSQPVRFGPLQDTVTQVSLDLSVTTTLIVERDFFDCLHVFTIGDDGALWTVRQTVANARWGSWTSLGGRIDMLAVGRNADGRLEVFARGLDKALWHIWQVTPGGDWSRWASLGRPLNGLIDMLEVGRNADGRLEVFARGPDKVLWHIWQTHFFIWSSWSPLGGPLDGTIDMLEVGRNADGRLEVFVRGSDKALYHKWQMAPNKGWSMKWKPLGGQIDMLAVGSNKDGRLEVFARGPDKALWHIWQLVAGGWSKPKSLGGPIDMLAVGSNQDGRLEVFVRGPDKALWHVWQLVAGGWSKPKLLGGWIDILAAGKNKDGRLEVFARGPDKALWHIWQLVAGGGADGKWSEPKSLGLPMWPISDRRKVEIYELGDSEIEFWNRRYDKSISTNTNTVYVPLSQLKSLESKRTLLLDDKEARSQAVIVTGATSRDAGEDGQDDHLAITFTPALTRKLDTGTAVLYGNVAEATHGETVAGDVLGSGDASTKFQSFSLDKSPVTFVPQAGASGGAANTLQVRAGGLLWHEVRNLYGRRGDERVYTTAVDDDGEMTVRFGDGVTGARLPSGRNNVATTYRQGLGKEGNVKANALTTLLDLPLGLKSVTNPAAAEGGAEPETLKKARTNAPNTVRTFKRIVSLRDFEDAAREYIGVAKARAVSVWDGEEQAVHLTVAGDDGAVIKGSAMENLVKDLDSRRDPNRKLSVRSYVAVAVKVEAAIWAGDEYEDKAVQASAEKALRNYFAFVNLDLGQPIHLSNVYEVLQNVRGVVAVDVSYLNFKAGKLVRESHGASENAVQNHLRIFPTELAVVKPSSDARVKVERKKL